MGPRFVERVSTGVLIVAWVLSLSAFGIGCYLLATASTVFAVGAGSMALMFGLPIALLVTIAWRDKYYKR